MISAEPPNWAYEFKRTKTKKGTPFITEFLYTELELSFSRASCRIRTNDPEITNHVLWPTELKRREGKLTVSRSDTNYLCCGQALEDSKGANRTALTHVRVLFCSDFSVVCECKSRTFCRNYQTFCLFFSKKFIFLVFPGFSGLFPGYFT